MLLKLIGESYKLLIQDKVVKGYNLTTFFMYKKHFCTIVIQIIKQEIH